MSHLKDITGSDGDELAGEENHLLRDSEYLHHGSAEDREVAHASRRGSHPVTDRRSSRTRFPHDL